MFLLTDKIEKEEQIEPQAIYKMPENGTKAKAQMTLRGIAPFKIAIEHPEKNQDPRKDMQQVRSGDHIQKGRGHVALGSRCIQARIDQLLKSIELVEHESKTKGQGYSEINASL